MPRHFGSPHRALALRVAQAVAPIYNVDPLWILGARRTKTLSEARHATYWVLRAAQLPQLSWPEIGAAMNRDQGTVRNGVKKFHARFLSDPLLSISIAMVIRNL